jgi:hypothetical protein
VPVYPKLVGKSLTLNFLDSSNFLVVGLRKIIYPSFFLEITATACRDPSFATSLIAKS